MIIHDDIPYYPYVFYTEHGPVMGLDPRRASAIEDEWFARARRSAERDALRARASSRSELHNLRLLHQKTQGDSVLGTGGVATEAGDPVTLDEVASPPTIAFAEDEVLRLSGLPDGYGYVAMVAAQVSGISRAGGKDADDFCAGVDTWLAREEKAVPKKTKKATKKRKSGK